MSGANKTKASSLRVVKWCTLLTTPSPMNDKESLLEFIAAVGRIYHENLQLMSVPPHVTLMWHTVHGQDTSKLIHSSSYLGMPMYGHIVSLSCGLWHLWWQSAPYLGKYGHSLANIDDQPGLVDASMLKRQRSPCSLALTQADACVHVPTRLY